MKRFALYASTFAVGFCVSFIVRTSLVMDDIHQYGRREYRRGFDYGVSTVQNDAIQHGVARFDLSDERNFVWMPARIYDGPYPGKDALVKP